MTDQNRVSILKKCESRWTVRQPTDVFRRPAQQRSFRRHKAAVRGRTYRFDKSKDNAFRGLRLKELVVGGIDKIADEEPAALPRAGGPRSEESVSAQRSARLKDRTIASQVGRGERSNPNV